MQNIKKIGLILSTVILLSGCKVHKNCNTNTPVIPGSNIINISTTPSPVGNVMMGSEFAFTATLVGTNIDNQALTIASTEPGVTITSNPSPCVLNAINGPSSCTFTVTTPWNNSLPNAAVIDYKINISNQGSAILSQNSIDYKLETPRVYLPQTGVTPEESEVTGISWPEARFIQDTNTSGAGPCMIDNLTGLEWLKNANYSAGDFNNPTTFAGAQTDVTNFNSGGGACGDTDWRLPTTNELYSLIDHSNSTGPYSYLGAYFTNVQQGRYWSSTPVASDFATSAWTDDMQFGLITADPQVNGHSIWLVRGTLTKSKGVQ